MEIEIVPVYRIKGDSSRKAYRTYKGVVSRLAWKMVADKYWGRMTYNNSQNHDSFGFELEKLPGDLECECISEADLKADGMYYTETWECCPIHDRETGYLRRLHDRLVAYIMLRYPMPRLATTE